MQDIKDKDVQLKTNINESQYKVIKLYQQLMNFKSVSSLMKHALLSEVKKLPYKVKLSIKRTENKLNILELKFGGKTKAIKEQEYIKLFKAMNELIKIKDLYEELILKTFSKPNLTKLMSNIPSQSSTNPTLPKK